MTFPTRLLRLVLALSASAGPLVGASTRDLDAESRRSPANQVFQFAQTDTFEYAADNVVTTSAYLWIPEHCQRLRGLLILGQNVPEHTLVGHPAIRSVCAANDLGIVWHTPSFFSTKNKDAAKTVAFLQRLLRSLAVTSGYEEVATVPWLPIGESGHLLMVDQLLDGAPERCIAGIFVKNAHYFCRNRETPVLIAVGTAQEWDQDKVDIRTRWNDLKFYDAIKKERAVFPNWPASLLIEGGSGHFDCTEEMIRYFADYIAAAVTVRVPANGSTGLRPVTLGSGFIAELPLPNHVPVKPTGADRAPLSARTAPWFLTKELAERAYQSAAINWQAESQMPAFLDARGIPAPMTFRGITNPVPLETDQDGVTFQLRGGLLTSIPENFVAGDGPLARAPGEPIVEWICGAIAPQGGGKFQIALDRTWPKSPICVAVRHIGTARIRAAVQPGYLSLKPNVEGVDQTIRFPPIPDQGVDAGPIALKAVADSGLRVRYFVVAGPAVVNDDILTFTEIPPRTRFPVKVTVTAWQWGRSTAPKIKTANVVTQSFLLAPRPGAPSVKP